MKNIYMWAVALAVIFIGGYWYMQRGGVGESETADLGSYEYVCDSGAKFTMTPASDVLSVRVTPSANAPFAEAVLTHAGGARFEGGGMTFSGAGEEVRITVGRVRMTCHPKPSSDLAPWNWGDPGEGGNTALIVSDSIVGNWKSVDDAKFTREFKSGGSVIDRYEGKEVSNGSWKVFTKETPLAVSFPLDASVAYLQLTMSGTQGDALNFKVSKLMPDALELVYMDRGDILRFEAVQ